MAAGTRPLALAMVLGQSAFRERQRGFVNGSGGHQWRIWGARIGLVAAVGLLLGRLGPFGTFAEIATAERYFYWVGLTFLMWGQSVAALALLRTAKLPDWGRLVAAALGGALPTAFEVAWAEMLLRVERDLGLTDIVMIYGDVALLSVPLLLATHLLLRTPHTPPPQALSEEGIDWLLARLKPDRRGQLLALESEDHYVRVRTSAGDELLHMRFGDAVARLPAQLGSRVHRSWWVARDAVRSQRRDGDRILIQLLDGTEVPVSRSYAIAAREAGLIVGG